MLFNYHIGRFVLGSLCVGDLVRLDLFSIRVAACTTDTKRVRHHPHRTHDLRRTSQDHHPSKNSVQKTVCCNSMSNAPDDGRVCPKHVDFKNTSIKLPSCVKLAFHIISYIHT